MATRLYQGYFNRVGSGVTVERQLFDAADLATLDINLATSIKYIIKLDKRVTGYTFSNAQIQIVDTAATITVVTPQETGVMSSPPLAGYWNFNCPDPSNPALIYTTENIPWYDSFAAIQNHIDATMPFLASKVWVKLADSEDNQWYYENQRNFYIVADGLDQDLPQCYITSSADAPLTGAEPTFHAETLREYGQNLFFEPVPLEMLYHAASKPQVLVTVDDMPALCANLNCDYLYTEPTG